MGINTYPLLRLFSSAVVKEWATQGKSPLAQELFRESNAPKFPERTTVRRFYDSVFELLMKKDAQREYLFKSVIVSQLWRGEHSTNSLLIPEFRVGECRADMVIFNGTSTAYEIKTERDNFYRLENQLKEYGKVFDKIFLVTTRKIYENVSASLPVHIGVMIFDESQKSLIRERSAMSNKVFTSSSAIFDCLKKSEYSEILQKKLKISLEDVPPVFHWKIAKDYFERISSKDAHDEMVKVVKKRKNNKRLSVFLENMPQGLFSRLLSMPLSIREMNSLTEVMSKKIRDLI